MTVPPRGDQKPEEAPLVQPAGLPDGDVCTIVERSRASEGPSRTGPPLQTAVRPLPPAAVAGHSLEDSGLARTPSSIRTEG